MRIGQRFILLFVATLGVTAFGLTLHDETMQRSISFQRQSIYQEKNAQTTSMCKKYSSIMPLSVSLKGKAISIQGADSFAVSQIAGYARGALPGTPVFANGEYIESIGYGFPAFVRTGAPADAILVKVSAQQVETGTVEKSQILQSGERGMTVTVTDSAGNMLGEWKGVMGGECYNYYGRNQAPLDAFFASKRSMVSFQLDRKFTSPYQDLQFEIQATHNSNQVALPGDFSTPASTLGCEASLIQENNARDKTLQITTGVGKIMFRYIQEDQMLPAVTCNEDQYAILFRTPEQVSVVTLNRHGQIQGVGRVPFKKIVDREAFRDVRIEKGKLHATLWAFEPDKKGTLFAHDGMTLAVALGTAPELAKESGNNLGLIKYTGCNEPPKLSPEIQVHELPNMTPAYEYVYVPGQAPVPFRSVVVDAPLQSVAVSFPKAATEMVWLIQATPGTDLRYVEITSDKPQTVLMRGNNTVVNVAKDASCPTLFSGTSRSSFHNIRRAYAGSGGREAIGLVLLANGNPFVSREFTEQAVNAFGYQHVSSMSGYFMKLKEEGILEEATPEDIQRFNDYYYQSLSFGRKLASWFRLDPGLDIHTGTGTGYIVKGAFALPNYPEGSSTTPPPFTNPLLLVEKGAPIPSGNLQTYIVLDANSISCAGAQSTCPWAK